MEPKQPPSWSGLKIGVWVALSLAISILVAVLAGRVPGIVLGLGLAVVHGIIREHSGNIYVDSKEDAGTEFVMSLPVTQIFAREKV